MTQMQSFWKEMGPDSAREGRRLPIPARGTARSCMIRLDICDGRCRGDGDPLERGGKPDRIGARQPAELCKKDAADTGGGHARLHPL